MRPLRLLLLTCFCLLLWPSVGFGGEYRLNNGDILRGEAVSFNDDGLVVRLDIGGHSPRISWSKLTQETLKELAANPAATRFVEPFIEEPPVPREKITKRQIALKPVPRVSRIEKPNFFASIATPAGIAIGLVLLLGNLYAAYEIARYRNRPPGLVCGVSLLLPVIGPALFLAMPTAEGHIADEAVPPEAAAQAAGKSTTGPLAKTPMASGLSIAHGEKPGGAPAAASGPQSYKRGEFTFNRRFMETKFPGFFRVVQGEAEKDLVLVVRTAKEEHIAKRISRISTNELHLQPLRGSEVSVAFAEIVEVLVRHKDAKA